MNLTTRAELARRKGVSRSAITQGCRDGGPLAAAVVGKRVDLDHPSVRIWLSQTDHVTPKDDLLALARRKKTAEAVRLELANAEKAGSLISRELVQTHVFGLIESSNKRLLGDAPPSIARRAQALARANEPIETIEAAVREIISQHLSHVKVQAVRALRGGK